MRDEKPHVVLIEDDLMLADLTANYLKQNEFDVTTYYCAESFIQQVDYQKIDVILCDVNLPKLNGFKLCELVRKSYFGPYIFLTAKKEDEDQILGLDLGADDYIPKPVKPALLLAKIRAAVRRNTTADKPNKPSKIDLVDFTIDRQSQVAILHGTVISLTSDEVELLWYLALHKGNCVSREQVFSDLIGRPYDGQDRVLDGRISRLRKKFNSQLNNPYEIKTVWRKGYVFSDRIKDV